MMFGFAESEHPRLTMVKLFQMYSNLCDQNPPTLQTDRRTERRTDGQTDRQTTCDGNTALCTKVHRAVKTSKSLQMHRNSEG